ncbi:MAG TPA: hypothetical protein DD415_01200 [Clostridiales bacterium]|nr:hypothetical protein [Clostridiales bacterium]
MPDYFSHGVAAEIIFEKLDTKHKSLIASKKLYFLGAQGGDVFFTYAMTPTESNIGRTMHKKSAAHLFERLILGNISYAAGFATHYALDSMLHPEVYAYEKTRRNPLAHTRFESDLGLFISRKYGLRRQILPKEILLSCTGPVYDSIKLIEPKVTLSGVERCLKRYFAYTRFIYRTKKQDYKCDYDFAGLSESVDKTVEFGVTAVKCVLDKNIDAEVFGKEFLNK